MVLQASSTVIFAPNLAKINKKLTVFEAADGSRVREQTLKGELDSFVNHDNVIWDFLGAIGIQNSPL